MVVGRTTTPYISEGIDLFTKRIQHFAPFEIATISDVKTSKTMTPDMQKRLEGQQIMSRLSTSDHVILLDERGREYTSREFAALVEQRAVTGVKNLVFIVGGPYGFSEEVYARANGKISFSKMTFPHELIRLIFVEQLYRAHTILNNLPYHHD